MHQRNKTEEKKEEVEPQGQALAKKDVQINEKTEKEKNLKI